MSLVEIMVALAIGMAASIVMLQVFALSEGRKRTATGAGDVQGITAIAFNQLKQEVSQAGFGFSASDAFGCRMVWNAGGAAVATAVPMVPVVINPAAAIIPPGDANTDTLLLIYGNTNSQPQGNTINGVAGSIYTVQSPNSFAIGDRVVAVPAACGALDNLSLDQVTAVGPTTVTTAIGGAGATLYNLGNAPSILAYAVRGGNLTVCDYMQNDCGTADTANAAVWVPVANNIVSLRAQYGRNVDDPAGDLAYDQNTPMTGCGWMRTPAIRIALVGRSGQFEKEIVTRTARNGAVTNAPSWPGDADAPLVGGQGNLGPDNVADEPWKHYRYRVLSGQLPIRNVIWMEGGGCA